MTHHGVMCDGDALSLVQAHIPGVVFAIGRFWLWDRNRGRDTVFTVHYFNASMLEVAHWHVCTGALSFMNPPRVWCQQFLDTLKWQQIIIPSPACDVNIPIEKLTDNPTLCAV